MKVKLLISRAGKGFSQTAGDVVDVNEREGAALIDAGKAEPVSFKETATKKTTARKATKG